MDLAIKNGKIVNAFGITEGNIGIKKGKIVAITADDLSGADKKIDARGKYIFPGVCDMHCHEDFSGTKEDGFQPWETISGTEPMAAALGGVTTMGFYMMRPGEQRISEFMSGYTEPFEKNAVTDCIFHIMVVNDIRMEDMEESCSNYGVTTFKFLIGYKGPQAAAQGSASMDDGFVFDGLKRIRKLREAGWPALALIHAENPDIIPYLTKEASKVYDVRAWHNSRPNFIEEECFRRIIFLAGVAGCPILIVHTTIKEAVDYTRKILSEGVKVGEDVIVETCPQYLTHHHDNLMKLQNEKPVFTVVNPPIRTKEDNEGLWKGIKEGLVQSVNSDTAPSSVKSKDVDMWKAPLVPMGLANNSTMILPVLISEGYHKRGLSLEKIAELSSYNPAKYYGINPQKGVIAVGSDADFAIVDLENELMWNNAKYSPSNSDWNIYEGWKFKGWPEMTILRGQVTVENMKIVAEPGVGRYIPRRKV
ncbi:MAG: amidohydrolase family protein [SAR202 cluster bacterium]|nr:amidohydrolase family protein [SAR202 cluster bacterium]